MYSDTILAPVDSLGIANQNADLKGPATSNRRKP